ncbi:hypothetical protein PAECIP111802_03529 [Paenibacillus allorhizosphaerae]|uniref:Uncharacterized protein n=1 Tax=Paenibacillus allorhizosphaerae TaxID=2849866 RepID=A0ABN7TQ14_9BACL|nr:hypothetical protein PAECIP111802_03529 [Paenibacillus allorhizosphaerae]
MSLTTIIVNHDVLPKPNTGLIKLDGECYRIVDENYEDELGSGALLVRCLSDKDKLDRKRTVYLLPEDLPEWIREGDLIHYIEGVWLVETNAHENLYGTFIALVPIEDPAFYELERKWQTTPGVSPNEENGNEIVKSLMIQDRRGNPNVVGYLLKNKQTGKVEALSYSEAWDKVYQEGTVNAYATISKLGAFQTKLLDSAEGLPPFDSKFWLTEALDANGLPRYDFSQSLQMDIKKMIKK